MRYPELTSVVFLRDDVSYLHVVIRASPYGKNQKQYKDYKPTQISFIVHLNLDR